MMATSTSSSPCRGTQGLRSSSWSIHRLMVTGTLHGLTVFPSAYGLALAVVVRACPQRILLLGIQLEKGLGRYAQMLAKAAVKRRQGVKPRGKRQLVDFHRERRRSQGAE